MLLGLPKTVKPSLKAYVKEAGHIFYTCRKTHSEINALINDCKKIVVQRILPCIVKAFQTMIASELALPIKHDLSGKFKQAACPRDFEIAFQDVHMCAELREALEMDEVSKVLIICSIRSSDT